MKLQKLYSVYVDDGETVFKVLTPAESAKEAEAFLSKTASGEIVAVKEDKHTTIDPYRVYDVLTSGGMSRYEAEVVMRLVSMSGMDCDRS